MNNFYCLTDLNCLIIYNDFDDSLDQIKGVVFFETILSEHIIEIQYEVYKIICEHSLNLLWNTTFKTTLEKLIYL